MSVTFQFYMYRDEFMRVNILHNSALFVPILYKLQCHTSCLEAGCHPCSVCFHDQNWETILKFIVMVNGKWQPYVIHHA